MNQGNPLPDNRGPDNRNLPDVGCYTSEERGGHGAGITVFEIEAKSGDWKEIQRLEIFNPSFLAFDRNSRYLYHAQAVSASLPRSIHPGQPAV